ncbi:nuclear pore complex protein DDB_G0274915-like [Venturia canescens]|uniref:nuclear pore complex protein DDB_G0274915-like n=1 Tax=Venturia canescens TaxID=32260 RepID=UPI001C9C2147|nr:nuclear pore complex protein DDB_G0274915-like [Venturia canescens]
MWDLRNRDIVALVTVTSGWAVLLNIFGTYIGSTLIIGLVLCGWLIYNGGCDDTLLSPHVFLALDCLKQAASETYRFLAHICQQFILDIIIFKRNLRHRYRVNIADRMAQRRRSTYQLSSEIHSSSRNSSGHSLLDNPSPIARRDFRNFDNFTNLQSTPYLHTDRTVSERTSSLDLYTSTPFSSWKKEDAENGDVSTANETRSDSNTWKNSQTFTQNYTVSKDDRTNYSPKGSPWGMSISPKMRLRATGIKTVQTIAGPLLASTRYNIDPKVYSDVTSPGLTTRLTKYATEANTKLTHQSQYGTGQFPRVNLNSSPLPLINAKTGGKTRMTVTVRIAPPETGRNVKYERKQILSEICQAEKKEQQQSSVVQVLREISLKRHASREDVTYETAKKQRTEGVHSEGLENLDEMMQKRGRDDSSKSEEEVSPHGKPLRPAKRSKMPSCHDILSSLSSSINVSSGVKRKALDVSRSGTPEVGKHFKSLDSSHSDIEDYTTCPSRSISEPTKTSKLLLNDSATQILNLERPNKRSLESFLENVLSKSRSPAVAVSNTAAPLEATGMQREILKLQVQPPTVQEEVPVVPVKLAEKLFMKAKPENIDKIKILIEEHGSVKPRFANDSINEIKKSDIMNMRQTSMKNRLKSMFEAISGKGTSKINPEVVIQAEDKSASSDSIIVSLSSSTSTTNVNTSPIATSAIVPIIGKFKPTTTPAKHVSFQFTNNDTSSKSSSNFENSQFSPQEAKNLEHSRLVKTCLANKNIVDSKLATSPLFTSVTTSPSKPVSQISFPVSTQLTETPTPTGRPAVVVSTTTLTPQHNSSTIPMFEIPTTTATITTTTITTKSDCTSFSSSQPSEMNQSTVNFSFGVSKIENPAFIDQIAGSSRNIQSPVTSEARSNETGSALAPIIVPPTKPTSVFSSDSTIKSTVSEEISSTVSLVEASCSANKGAAKSTSMGSWEGALAEEKVAVQNQSLPFEEVPLSGPALKTSPGFNFVKRTTSDILFGASGASTGYSALTNTTTFPMGGNSTLSATTKPAFSFGVTTPVTTSLATTSSSAPSLSFGVTRTNSSISIFEGVASTITLANAQSNIFGTQTTTSSLPGQSNLFGKPVTTVASATTTTQPSIFGTPTATASTMTIQPSIFAFGTDNGGQTTSFSNTFSGTLQKPKQPETGDGTTIAAASSSSSMTFASTCKTSAPLNSVNKESNALTSATLLTFGSSGFGQKPTSASFGNDAPVPGFTTSTGNTSSLFEARANGTFGAASLVPLGTTGSAPSYRFPSSVTSTPAFGTPNTTPPTFGAFNTSTTSFGAITTAAPTFGSLNTTTPTFGTPNPSTVTIAHQNPPASSNFNSSNNTTFGATVTTPSVFPSVSTSTGFGTSIGSTTFGTSTNPPTAFSTAKTFTSFSSPPTNTAMPFGIQTSAPNSSFGSAVVTPSSTGFGANVTNSNSNNDGHNSSTTSSFTFGASQSNQPPQQPQQQNAIFTFGGTSSTSSNNTTSGSSTFQFNSAPQQNGGFNFTGAPTAPAINFSKDSASGSSFALPTPGAGSFSLPPTTGGMFSIGTGSTAPRSRPSRRRQR